MLINQTKCPASVTSPFPLINTMKDMHPPPAPLILRLQKEIDTTWEGPFVGRKTEKGSGKEPENQWGMMGRIEPTPFLLYLWPGGSVTYQKKVETLPIYYGHHCIHSSCHYKKYSRHSVENWLTRWMNKPESDKEAATLLSLIWHKIAIHPVISDSLEVLLWIHISQ